MINTGLGGKEKARFQALGPEWSALTGLRKRSQPRLQQPGTVGAVGNQDCGDLTLLAAVRTGHTRGLNQEIKGNPGLLAFRTCTFSNISHNLLKHT